MADEPPEITYADLPVLLEQAFAPMREALERFRQSVIATYTVTEEALLPIVREITILLPVTPNRRWREAARVRRMWDRRFPP